VPKGIYKRTKPGSFKGKKHTKETKNKMSESWDYDKHITKGFREKLSRANSGKNNPMYGKPITDEHRKHLVESHVGQIAWNKGKRFPQVTGNKNGNWKGGVTPEIHKRLMVSYCGNNRINNWCLWWGIMATLAIYKSIL